MTKSAPLQHPLTAPSHVWERLDAEQQHRALQLLAQMALHFIAAHGQTSHREDSLCSPSNDPQSYVLTISHAQR
jgi:hypothetical protein